MSLLLKWHTTMWKWLWHFFLRIPRFAQEAYISKNILTVFLIHIVKNLYPCFKCVFHCTLSGYTAPQCDCIHFYRITGKSQVRYSNDEIQVLFFSFCKCQDLLFDNCCYRKNHASIIFVYCVLKVPYCANFQVPSFSLDSLRVTASNIWNINLIGLWMQICCTRNKSPFTQSITGIS